MLSIVEEIIARQRAGSAELERERMAVRERLIGDGVTLAEQALLGAAYELHGTYLHFGRRTVCVKYDDEYHRYSLDGLACPADQVRVTLVAMLAEG